MFLDWCDSTIQLGLPQGTSGAHCDGLGHGIARVALRLGLSCFLAACGGGGDSTSQNSATLAWDSTGDPTVDGYRIYFGTTSGTYMQAPNQGLDVGNVTVYTVTGLDNGTRYYFAATAYDTMGNESGYSNEVVKDVQ